jgi:hypothetical protein
VNGVHSIRPVMDKRSELIAAFDENRRGEYSLAKMPLKTRVCARCSSSIAGKDAINSHQM